MNQLHVYIPIWIYFNRAFAPKHLKNSASQSIIYSCAHGCRTKEFEIFEGFLIRLLEMRYSKKNYSYQNKHNQFTVMQYVMQLSNNLIILT